MESLLQPIAGKCQLFDLFRLAIDIHRLSVERYFHTGHVSEPQSNLFVGPDRAALLSVENALAQAFAIG